MPPIFDVSELMRWLDSLCYITGIHTYCFLYEGVRVCEDLIYVISCLINKELPMPMFGGRSPDWLGEPR